MPQPTWSEHLQELKSIFHWSVQYSRHVGEPKACQGCSGELASNFCSCWHLTQVCTFFSNASSIPGHQPFIWVMPGCPSCNSDIIESRSPRGTTTRLPHSMHPSWTLNSSFLVWNGFISESAESLYPLITFSLTCDSSGSRSTPFLMWVMESDVRCSTSTRHTNSPGRGTVAGASGNGRWLSKSALACFVPGLYSMTYSYALSVSAQHCTRADAMVGMPRD